MWYLLNRNLNNKVWVEYLNYMYLLLDNIVKNFIKKVKYKRFWVIFYVKS